MILHIIRDTNDSAWDCWDVYNERDSFVTKEDVLRRLRGYYGPLHRGYHPDKSKVSTTPECFRGVRGVRVYWVEQPEAK